MKDDILEKYIGTAESRGQNTDEPDAVEDLGAYGILRGIRERALMLEIRMKDGSIAAFGYAWLDHATFDPSEGITLHFGGKTVKLVGRNLNGAIGPSLTFFSGLLRYRIPWIQEADASTLLEAPSNHLVIEEIYIEGMPTK